MKVSTGTAWVLANGGMYKQLVFPVSLFKFHILWECEHGSRWRRPKQTFSTHDIDHDLSWS